MYQSLLLSQVMEKKLFILLFLTGVLTSVPRKYYLIQQGKSWSEALASCRTNHRDLATIENTADLVKIQAEAQKHQFNSSAWIGLYKVEHHWTWSFRNETLGSWTIWNLGEPDNYVNREECGRSCSGIWNDVPCESLYPFMCFNESKTGNDRYIQYSAVKTWYEAQTFCRLNHNDLASMRNKTEYSVINTISPVECIWIGLSRISWKWSDQTSISSIAWAPGKPDNLLAFENCGAFQAGLNIDDERCAMLKPFFCSSVIIGQQQIIRMKVQSDQDVNDPAVRAVLLEQIQRKLEHHGMLNVTVKFRKHQD